MKLRNVLFPFTAVRVLKDALNPGPPPAHLPHSPGKKESFFQFPDPVPVPSVPLRSPLSIQQMDTEIAGGARDPPGPPPPAGEHPTRGLPPSVGLSRAAEGTPRGGLLPLRSALLCVPRVAIREVHPRESRQTCLLRLRCSRGSATWLVFTGTQGQAGEGGASQWKREGFG